MRKSTKLILYPGCALIAASFILLILSLIQTYSANQTNAEIIRQTELLLADKREASSDYERSSEMPSIEINGNDYIAILEVPSYGLKLPVYKNWDKTKVMTVPCRFSGSAYNATLIIGGYDRTGQFDFFDRICDGDKVTVTDMTGAEFSYIITKIERRSEASADFLTNSDAALTLFVRDSRYNEYIILRCTEK